jgi:hypothetical protein
MLYAVYYVLPNAVLTQPSNHVYCIQPVMCQLRLYVHVHTAYT